MKEKRRRGRPRIEDEKKKISRNVRMTNDDYETLRTLSDRLGVSISQVVRNAVAEYVSKV